jgi:hypothetical protein
MILKFLPTVLLFSLVLGLWTNLASAEDQPAKKKKPDFPPHKEILEGYEKVVSTMDGKPSLYTLWLRKKDNQVLAELPKSFAKQKQFIALTVASGERFAGLQAGEQYVRWERYDKRLALIAPNVSVRSTGDPESRDSVKRLYTDRLIAEVPIVTIGPKGAPVIDLDALLVGQAAKFFRASLNSKLIKVKTLKAFPENVEVAFEAPSATDGQIKTYHYSISLIPKNSYKPRIADQRIGYFVTSYTDLGKYKEDDKRTRYINRWQLEKADPSLKLSPPKNPIVFYIEHTTPRRYRYWVKEGILYWNKAFEKVGIRDAIEVRQQDNSDSKNPKHMEKDPEDVRYNFVRWLNNDIGTAIGPSRVNPLTGQILDADIVLTDGWIRHYERQYNEVMPKLAMEGFSPQTMSWLSKHPDWDPRIRLAPPAKREKIAHEIARNAHNHGGHPAAIADPSFLGDDEYDGLFGHTSQKNGLCLAAEGKALDLALLRMNLELAAIAAEQKKNSKDEKDKDDDKDEDGEKEDADEDEDDEDEDDDKDGDEKDEDEDDDKDVKDDDDEKDEEENDDTDEDEEKDEEQKLDGIPERFVGPLLAELVAHEVGHTLGLRHNFKASMIYDLKTINSGELNGKPHAGSVMDYLPINMPVEGCEHHGNYTMNSIGPYDMWAIEYGYTFEKDLKPILARVAEPELIFGTDEDTWGPDPRARRYDFSKNPLEYAKDQLELADYHRQRLLQEFVKDGDSWAKARRGYELTLHLQMRAAGMMANWVGGAYIHRDKKGDKEGRVPIEVVSAERQREALKFVIENTFQDDAFGLSPDLLKHLGVDQWWGEGFWDAEVDWPVHDRIMGIQASILTALMKSDTLRQVYDNEMRTLADEDALTLPELLDTISDAIWSELAQKPTEKTTARKPWISSLRANLQREHLNRLIDLNLSESSFSAAYRPISNLSQMRLRKIQDQVAAALEQKALLDPYSLAHLQQVQMRIEKALDAQYILNADKIGGRGGGIIIHIGEED